MHVNIGHWHIAAWRPLVISLSQIGSILFEKVNKGTGLKKHRQLVGGQNINVNHGFII